MAGWDLKEGELTEEKLSEIEIWSLVNKFLSKKTIMKNLYKILLLKSLINVISKKEVKKNNMFSYVLEEFAELFWNIKLDLNVNMTLFNGVSKISKQEEIINNIYKNNSNTKFISFKELKDSLKKEYIFKTKEVLRTNVIGAIYNDFERKLYSFNLREEKIILKEEFYDFFKKNRKIIFKLLDYREVEFLRITEKNSLKIENYIQKKLNLDKYSEDFYKVIEEEIIKKTNRG